MNFLLGTFFVTLASSQCFSSIPECAQQCLTNAVSAATECGSSDWTCQCTTDHQEAIQESARNCVFASCGDDVSFGKLTSLCLWNPPLSLWQPRHVLSKLCVGLGIMNVIHFDAYIIKTEP